MWNNNFEFGIVVPPTPHQSCPRAQWSDRDSSKTGDMLASQDSIYYPLHVDADQLLSFSALDWMKIFAQVRLSGS